MKDLFLYNLQNHQRLLFHTSQKQNLGSRGTAACRSSSAHPPTRSRHGLGRQRRQQLSCGTSGTNAHGRTGPVERKQGKGAWSDEDPEPGLRLRSAGAMTLRCRILSGHQGDRRCWAAARRLGRRLPSAWSQRQESADRWRFSARFTWLGKLGARTHTASLARKCVKAAAVLAWCNWWGPARRPCPRPGRLH